MSAQRSIRALCESVKRPKERNIIMTYSEFLDRYCDCHEDKVGNRPCDNGYICDKCMTNEIWKEVHDND